MPEPVAKPPPTDGVPPPSLVVGLRVLWDTSARSTVGFVTLAVSLGLVPAAAALASGRVVEAVPDAARAGGGLSTPEGRRLAAAIAVLTAIFVVGQVAQVLGTALREGFRQRVYYRVESRAMAAVLAPPMVDHLERPDRRRLVDLATYRTWPNMFAFTGDLMMMVTARVSALSAAALVGRWDVRVAAGLVVVWALVGRRRRRRMAIAYAGAGPVQRPQYYRRLALDRGTAAELRVFGIGPWIRGRFDEGWRDAMGGVWAARRATRAELAVLTVVVVAVNGVACALLADAARDGRLSAADIMVVGSAMGALAQLAMAGSHDRGVAEGAAVVPAILELEHAAEQYRATRVVTRSAGVDVATLPQREIRFDDVTFSYPGRDQPVLRGLDLVIPAGRSLAVVGANGAGKTTLVKLLARLHDPDGGAVLVDSVDVRHLPAEGWQRRVAAIFQDFTRYELSAADNVEFGAVEHAGDVARRRRAAERAGALDLVEGLSEGWDTVLSRRFERGSELSGGQWQRLALARALYAVEAGAGVLVLDEPTANLDVRAEVELFDRFLDVTRGATTVLISHRFSTVRRADHIVVLEDGAVAEQGCHDDLVAGGGRYAAMFALQARRYRDEAPR